MVAMDYDVTPKLSITKGMATNGFFFNMSGIFIVVLPNCRILCKKIYYSGVGFIFQSDFRMI